MTNDDDIHDPHELEKLRRHARSALEAADALGVFPTPVEAIVAAANVDVAPCDGIDEGFLRRMRQKAKDAGGALKRALAKVLGVFDSIGGIAYIDSSVHVVKQTFLKLHEAGHALLPWQRRMYAVVEDCEKTIAPEISELFGREANAFASEVLFQLDTFTNEAADHEFGIRVPLNLAKRYGSSVYAAVRRYVSRNERTCAVLVLNPPEFSEGAGFTATRRRVVTSPSFRTQFGGIRWPERISADDSLGAVVPIGRRRMSRPTEIVLRDRNGVRHTCIAEAFTQTYQVFILIQPVAALTRTSVVL